MQVSWAMHTVYDFSQNYVMRKCQKLQSWAFISRKFVKEGHFFCKNFQCHLSSLAFNSTTHGIFSMQLCVQEFAATCLAEKIYLQVLALFLLQV